MARGWESKSVEEQVEESKTTQTQVSPVETATEDPDKRHRLDSLKLVRSQVSEQLRNARSVTQRQMLHERLRAIDSDMEALG